MNQRIKNVIEVTSIDYAFEDSFKKQVHFKPIDSLLYLIKTMKSYQTSI